MNKKLSRYFIRIEFIPYPTLEVFVCLKTAPTLGSELVFPSKRTGGVQHDFRTSWESACRRAGVWPMRVYDLRHTFGCWAAMKGEDLFTLQRWMGHASITTTQRYAKHRPEEFRGKLDDLELHEASTGYVFGGGG